MCKAEDAIIDATSPSVHPLSVVLRTKLSFGNWIKLNTVEIVFPIHSVQFCSGESDFLCHIHSIKVTVFFSFAVCIGRNNFGFRKMDSNYEGAWDEKNNSMALNERYPINSNQSINYSTNDYAETGVESQVNMANGMVVTKLNAPNEMPDICEPPNLAYYMKIWKYMEQIKSIGAGQW